MQTHINKKYNKLKKYSHVYLEKKWIDILCIALERGIQLLFHSQSTATSASENRGNYKQNITSLYNEYNQAVFTTIPQFQGLICSQIGYWLCMSPALRNSRGWQGKPIFNRGGDVKKLLKCDIDRPDFWYKTWVYDGNACHRQRGVCVNDKGGGT